MGSDGMLAALKQSSKEAQWSAAAYAVNCFIVQTSMFGWYGETNSAMSRKYQTFVTPAGWAFSIWSYIFLSQLVFTVYTLLPSSHAHCATVVQAIWMPWISAQ
eukprot:CAMPEP_0174937372 /NCGR_PEP_ID=MMETSP1355-20121228/60286_1 /TAXON_ID=464990 /ORGANISM="Hemiselmis tepida, Strain CCMP443" /LENGTH=102 /DNA_ID=CAMNT_0016184217 /DNA_START=92 /DNA_END=397 /DNA_ORIENTATION=+